MEARAYKNGGSFLCTFGGSDNEVWQWVGHRENIVCRLENQSGIEDSWSASLLSFWDECLRHALPLTWVIVTYPSFLSGRRGRGERRLREIVGMIPNGIKSGNGFGLLPVEWMVVRPWNCSVTIPSHHVCEGHSFAYVEGSGHDLDGFPSGGQGKETGKDQ